MSIWSGGAVRAGSNFHQAYKLCSYHLSHLPSNTESKESKLQGPRTLQEAMVCTHTGEGVPVMPLFALTFCVPI